jgi:hypothetical protein
MNAGKGLQISANRIPAWLAGVFYIKMLQA